jgi:hypothetical protein
MMGPEMRIFNHVVNLRQDLEQKHEHEKHLFVEGLEINENLPYIAVERVKNQ